MQYLVQDWATQYDSTEVYQIGSVSTHGRNVFKYEYLETIHMQKHSQINGSIFGFKTLRFVTDFLFKIIN